MIYSTGSMGSYINAGKDKWLEISNFLNNKFPVFNFSFGGVFYRDPIDCSSDINETHVLTNNIPKLQAFIGKIRATREGDLPEDWIEAYKFILDMNWREGTKLIIHIPAYGYYKDDSHMNEKYKLIKIVKI